MIASLTLSTRVVWGEVQNIPGGQDVDFFEENVKV